MIPLKTDEVLKKIPGITILVIGFCIVSHFCALKHVLVRGLVPLDILYSVLHFDRELPGSIVTLFASFFIHGSFLHLAGNMWYLWIFGSSLEQRLTHVHFAIVYVAFGIVSMAAQVLSNPLSTIPVVGASGAIAGIMGMYLVVRPFSWIVFYLPPFFSFKAPALLFLLGWFVLQWLNAQAPVDKSMVAWWAHIGGFIAGIVCGCYYRITFWLGKQNHSRKSITKMRKSPRQGFR